MENNDTLEVIQRIPLDKLRPYPDHPFGVRDDDMMQQTVESIKQFGVLVPGIARPLPDGSFELIAGHRRKQASAIAGLTDMPIIVRDIDRNAATIIMVDSKEDIETPVVKAPREKNIIPGSFATPEAIAHIMTQKFVMGSPLYRQEQELNRKGISLSRQTMSNWILKATEDYLLPVYEQLHKELLKRDVLHADETTLQVLHEPGKKPQSDSYMWLYRTSGDTDKPIVLYEYQPGRGAKHPKEFLAGYAGYLHTDGYAGYHDLGEDITVVGCWAHARRKFDEAVKSLPKGKAKGSSASQGLAYCNLLFEIEQGLSEETADERYEQRLKQTKPVLDAMLSWANTRTAATKSALGKAFTYLKEQWPYLTNYLNDGRLEISNNRAERSIKPFVIDRKNFLFANTPKGATGSAIMFSLIQTAIENGLDPYKYLTWLLRKAKNADLTDARTIQSLLPWNSMTECQTK